jgi:arylsulfatase A
MIAFSLIQAILAHGTNVVADDGDISISRSPNIIYINTDDLGIGKVPPYKMDPSSERIIQTPNLDRLRSEGMLFTNSYAGNAVCGPSRCVLLTGKHPGHAAWRANQANPPVAEWPPTDPMLGEVAQQAGYKTAAFGKVSAGGTQTPEHITQAGWDYWLGFLGHVDCRDYYASEIWENGELISVPANTPELLAGTNLNSGGTGVVGEGRGTFIEDLYADTIIDFMTENQNEPFFIYYASAVPHGGNPGGMRVPSLGAYEDMDLTQREKVYCELITRHDANVGRLVQAVKDLGIANNTIILWTSDNGDENSYYKRTETFDGNGPFRDMKRSLYEGGIRTPLIAYWSGVIEPNSTCDLITTQCDIMPTVADAGGSLVTDAMDGISIFPTLRGDSASQTSREYVYFEFYEKAKQQSVRIGDWKGYRRGGWNGTFELYDLSQDIAEERDILESHPEIVHRMEEIMRAEHEPHPVWNLD